MADSVGSMFDASASVLAAADHDRAAETVAKDGIFKMIESYDSKGFKPYTDFYENEVEKLTTEQKQNRMGGHALNYLFFKNI